MGTVGIVGYLVGTVFVNRKNPRDAYTKLSNAEEIMAKNEVSKQSYKVCFNKVGNKL